MVYINLETNLTIASYFTDNIAPERLLRYLEASAGERTIPGERLIILDEIQSCERALTSLKDFCEETPEFHIVAAGSLLGVAINRQRYSFPVGKVETITLYPLDFEEFLWARGKEVLCEEIHRAYEAMEPLPEALHQEAIELYREYLLIGIEVKKGEHVRSRSLSVFINNYKPAHSIRLSLKNFGEKDRLKSIPLYAIFCI